MNLADCLIYNLCKTRTLTFHVKQAVFFSFNQEGKFVGSHCTFSLHVLICPSGFLRMLWLTVPVVIIAILLLKQ